MLNYFFLVAYLHYLNCVIKIQLIKNLLNLLLPFHVFVSIVSKIYIYVRTRFDLNPEQEWT